VIRALSGELEAGTSIGSKEGISLAKIAAAYRQVKNGAAGLSAIPVLRVRY